MSEEHKQYASTAAATLEAHILSVHSAKNEAEWWASHEILRLRAENEKLRAALKPFAELAEYYDVESDAQPAWDRDFQPTVGELRAAAAALKEAGDD